MPDFLTLLSLYYICDAMIVQKPMAMTHAQLLECTEYYTSVKESFANAPFPEQNTPSGIAARRAAYAAFKAWELENGLLVTQMRAEASASVNSNG